MKYKALKDNPITYLEKPIDIQIRAFICDAPATSYVKGIKGHAGYYSCGKFVTSGDYLNNRTCFPVLNCMLRTDQTFLNRDQEDHHHHHQEDITIGMVSQFPLDYLHLVCLGA